MEVCDKRPILYRFALRRRGVGVRGWGFFIEAFRWSY